MSWPAVRGVVLQGHGVASGRADDPRFPEGTIRMQQPFFAALGFDISRFHPATMNVSIAPWRYEPLQPVFTVRQLRWCPLTEPEDFSFYACRVRWRGGGPCEGLVYRPHPETKPEHFQDPGTLEILTVRLEGLAYGDSVVLELAPEQIRLCGPLAPGG